MPKVSVISPIYNPGKYLCPLLDSICNQTLQDIEAILVDNGSTDGSREILLEYAEKDSRIQVIFRDQQQEHCGAKYAIDIGRERATGDYIIIVDHDDELVLNGLEKLYNASEGKADAVKGSALYNLDGEKFKYFPVISNVPIPSWDTLTLNSQIRHFCHAPELWTILLRRDFQKNIELGDFFFDDTDFVFKIKVLAKDFRYIEDPVYQWNIHSSSTSHIKNTKYAFEVFKIFDSIEKFLKENRINSEIWEVYAYLKFSTYRWFFESYVTDEVKDKFIEYVKRDFAREITLAPSHLSEKDKIFQKIIEQF